MSENELLLAQAKAKHAELLSQLNRSNLDVYCNELKIGLLLTQYLTNFSIEEFKDYVESKPQLTLSKAFDLVERYLKLKPQLQSV